MIANALKVVAPLVVGFAFGATVIALAGTWGVKLDQVASVLATVAVILMFFMLLLWGAYRYFTSRVVEGMDKIFAKVESNPDRFVDTAFRNETILRIAPKVAKAGFSYVSFISTIGVGLAVTTNLVLVATLSVQYLQAERLQLQNKLIAKSANISEIEFNNQKRLDIERAIIQLASLREGLGLNKFLGTFFRADKLTGVIHPSIYFKEVEGVRTTAGSFVQDGSSREWKKTSSGEIFKEEIEFFVYGGNRGPICSLSGNQVGLFSEFKCQSLFSQTSFGVSKAISLVNERMQKLRPIREIRERFTFGIIAQLYNHRDEAYDALGLGKVLFEFSDANLKLGGLLPNCGIGRKEQDRLVGEIGIIERSIRRLFTNPTLFSGYGKEKTVQRSSLLKEIFAGELQSEYFAPGASLSEYVDDFRREYRAVENTTKTFIEQCKTERELLHNWLIDRTSIE